MVGLINEVCLHGVTPCVAVLYFPCLCAVYAYTVKIFLVVADKYFHCGPITHKQLKNTRCSQHRFIYFIHIYYILRAFRF